MRMVGRTARVALLATWFATVLSSCALTPKAAPAVVDARADEPARTPAAAPAGPSAAGATRSIAVEGAPPAPASAPAARPRASPELERQVRARFTHAVAMQGQGDLEGASAAFEEARRSGVELPWAGLNAGVMQERLGNAELAGAAYEATIEAWPGFAPAGQNLVRLWLRQGRPLDQVERDLRERLARADGVALRVGLAEALLTGGQNAAAEEECKKALRTDERNVPAMVALANAYAARKRFELARMVLENARQVDEADPALWNRLGFVELALGNRAQAIEDFKTAASLRPDYPEAHANYGAILADADDFAGAAQELELAVTYAPRSAGAWLDLGNAHRGLQAFEKSEAAYQKALQLDPSLNDARFDLALLYLDVARTGLPTLQRLEQGIAWFDEFEKHGGKEPRVAAYRRDTAREVDREKKRLAREEKDRLRTEAAARKQAAEAAEAAKRQEAERPVAAPAPATPVTGTLEPGGAK